MRNVCPRSANYRSGTVMLCRGVIKGSGTNFFFSNRFRIAQLFLDTALLPVVHSFVDTARIVTNWLDNEGIEVSPWPP